MRLIDADRFEIISFKDKSEEFADGVQWLAEQIDNVPTVEAIPKADYENRLKADLKAMLEEIQLEIEEMQSREDWCDYATDNCIDRCGVDAIIQLKINALKGEQNDESI